MIIKQRYFFILLELFTFYCLTYIYYIYKYNDVQITCEPRANHVRSTCELPDVQVFRTDASEQVFSGDTGLISRGNYNVVPWLHVHSDGDTFFERVGCHSNRHV